MKTIHYGDYTDAELRAMSPQELIEIIKLIQMEDNFIIMTDSYKMTHHLLYPNEIQEVYSYMESRGGEMPYTVFTMLQYMLKKYFLGVRITQEKIDEAREKNIKHFGFDCFDSTMWDHIVRHHGGKLPLEIKAVPEGTPVAVKNIIMSVRNTDLKCAPLTNVSETLLMKLWAPSTVAAYDRLVRALIYKYHDLSSDAPKFLIDFMHHDFGYRGVSSEESARILGAAALSTGFVGTDTMGALVLIEKYYNEPMAGFSVIASEHSVVCSYGGRHNEAESYREIIRRVKEKCADVNPASGVIVLSLVSDTYNIYNVCHRIIPQLANDFIGWKNNHGIPIKIVVRPDSGDAKKVLFGYEDFGQDFFEAVQLAEKVSVDMGIGYDEAKDIVFKGIFQILFDQFGYSINSKGFRVLNPQIGLLQGDGVSYKVMSQIYPIMIEKKIDIMNLVFGSGGKLLQAHDRDEQKFAIKATHVIIKGEGIDIEKNPITDSSKKSKKGYLKLVQTGNNWSTFKTLQHGDEGFDEAKDELVPIFLNGELLIDYTFSQLRENSAIRESEFHLLESSI
jgi:nicotinamide phosphoribosyltransferase